MIATIKRQIALYFSNKASVFFSLMGAWIAFALYIIFLQKNMVEAWSTVPNPEVMLDQWVMGGVLAVTGVTTTWTGLSRLIKDKENHQFDDFLLTGVSPFSLHVGYLISASMIGLIMQIIMYSVMNAYFYWQDGLVLELNQLPALLGLMVLNSLLGSSLGLIGAQCFKTIEAAERFAIIIGTTSGFLVGVYMPIGGLPDFAQVLIKWTPAAYVAAAFRQILIADSLDQWTVPGMDVKEYLGVGLKWQELTSLGQNIMLIAVIIVVSLLFLLILLQGFGGRKGPSYRFYLDLKGGKEVDYVDSSD
jgi:multidrug/hemolysin transport system permease protein